MQYTTEKPRNRAVLVGLSSRALDPQDNASDATLDELSALLDTAGGVAVGQVLQNKDAPDPRTFIGEGKLAEVKDLVKVLDADLVLFDSSGCSPRSWESRCWTGRPSFWTSSPSGRRPRRGGSR